MIPLGLRPWMSPRRLDKVLVVLEFVLGVAQVYATYRRAKRSGKGNSR